ncbi:hypothetical protein [Bradyrhizobium sp. AZCC 1721]|uniref:hypothetical protein n=1 Tax=Bradyrhizobium sp. AZCC 1721 TaxID=3117016 RepID=UPI002FF12336
MNKRIGPLFFEKDPPEWRRWISILRVELGYYVKRCSEHHIKISKINFWPAKGTITLDGREAVEHGDWLGFLHIVLKTYPRRPNKKNRGELIAPPIDRPHALNPFSAALLSDVPTDQDETIVCVDLDSGELP